VVGPGGDDGAAVRKQLVVALTNHERLVAGNWLQLHFVESTDRLVSGHPAEVCLPACVLFAGVDTVVVFTGLVLGAVLINLTLTLSALDAGIAKRSRGTGAGESDAALVVTDKAPVAVGVPHALWPAAGDGVGFGDEVGDAPADGVAVGALGAGSVGSTGGGVAGVLWHLPSWGRGGPAKIEVLGICGPQQGQAY